MTLKLKQISTRLVIATVTALAWLPSAQAQAFDWKRANGQTINVLLNNHPWSQSMRELAKEFTAKTGVNVRIEVLAEEPFRTRQQTLLQARSKDVDVFMTLTMREGQLFDRAGWYENLSVLARDPSKTAPDFDLPDFGKGLITSHTVNGKLVGLPINTEGPLFYWRKDIFAKCKIAEPQFVEDIPVAAKALKACDPNQGVWAARGLRITIPYAMGAFVHNLGGEWKTADGKPNLCSDKVIAGMDMYASLLRDYGPPGATNHSFPQVVELLGQGRIAMTHESSNEFPNIMKFPGRDKDLGVKVLPKGKTSGISVPVNFGWGISLSSASEKKDASWYFIQWATSKEIQTRLVANGVAPPRSSVFAGAEMKKWAAESPIRGDWANAVNEISRTGTEIYQPPTERIAEARERMGRAVQEVVLGQKSTREAACEANKDAEKLL
jgi:multiple sugar transport system substrate-binding protein